MMEKLRVLITGVAGLIGSRLAAHIFAHNFNTKIYGIDNLSNGFKDNIPEGLSKFYKCDVEGNRFCKVFESIRPHYVFHFAAYAAECLSPFIRKYNYINNLVATANVVNCCIKHNVKRLVFTSSMAVYGRGVAPFDENATCNPIDPYGVAKHSCEQDIRIAAEQHGLEYCILRPHNCFGEGQNIWDKYRNVIGIWMRQSINKEPITIFGDGEQIRAFSYIGNCVEPIWVSASSNRARNETINIGGIEPISINKIAEMVSDITGNKNIIHVQGRHEVKEAYSTYNKSQHTIGYKENISLYNGIINMWQWVNSKCIRQKVRMFRKYEIDNGIYEYWKNI